MKKIFYLLLFIPCLTLLAQKKIPGIDLKDIHGAKISSQDFNEKDKLYVLSFWATWCIPCIQELDSFNDSYETWKSKLNLEIIAISVDDSRTVKRVKPMVNGKGWGFNVLFDENQEFKRKLGITSVPYLIIIKNGEIIFSQSGHTPGSEEELFNQLEKM